MLDFPSWRRAWTPALRAFGYVAVLYVLLLLFIVFPIFIIVSLGAPTLISQLTGTLIPIFMLLLLFLAIFKVLDEEKRELITLGTVK